MKKYWTLNPRDQAVRDFEIRYTTKNTQSC